MKQHNKLALAWYSEEEYDIFRSSSIDPKKWCDNYESWKKSAQSTFLTLTLEGSVVVKVPMILGDFQSWCNKFGANNDSAGRSRYAAWSSQNQ